MTSSGSGVGRVDGQAVFVPFTAVGDVVKIVIVKVNKTYAYGRLLEILTPSISRIENDCVAFPKCGGCTFRHIAYKEELRIKEEMVKNAFVKIGGIQANISPIVGANETLFYRNKAQLPVGKAPYNTAQIGFYTERSHSIVDTPNCLIGEEEFSSIVKTLRNWIDENNISAYHEESGKGLLRHIFLRIGKQTNEIMVCLVINGEDINKKTRLINALTKNHPNIKSIVLNINEKQGNVILGKSCVTIWGEDFIYDILGDIKFKISPLSFYQVNPLQTVHLYNKAVELCNLNGSETVLDLYCGIGTISLFLAKKALKVYGVEIVKEAVENAVENAVINQISNVEFFEGDAFLAAKKLFEKNISPNILVVDPPRKGCEKELLELMVRINPEKIVYISCDCATLARDAKILSENGYKVQEVHPFDMFPRTANTEVVTLLSRE